MSYIRKLDFEAQKKGPGGPEIYVRKKGMVRLFIV
jgi:hypothetical protein